MVVTTFSHSCTNPMLPLSVSAILTGSVSQLMGTSCPYTENIHFVTFVYVKGVGGKKKKKTVNKNTARDIVMSAVFCCCCENGALHFRW